MPFMTSLIKLIFVLVLLQQSTWADSFVQFDLTKPFEVQLTKDSVIGEASIREHTIVWHPLKKKYYLLADVIPLKSKYHPNTYESEIHLSQVAIYRTGSTMGLQLPKERQKETTIGMELPALYLRR